MDVSNASPLHVITCHLGAIWASQLPALPLEKNTHHFTQGNGYSFVSSIEVSISFTAVYGSISLGIGWAIRRGFSFFSKSVVIDKPPFRWREDKSFEPQSSRFLSSENPGQFHILSLPVSPSFLHGCLFLKARCLLPLQWTPLRERRLSHCVPHDCLFP